MWNFTCTNISDRTNNRLLLAIISRIIHYNRRTRVRLGTCPYCGSNRLVYHWNELWRSLLGLLKFLLAKADDLTDQNGIDLLVNNLIDLLATALAGGETFLPGTTDYDDLFYKLVQVTTPLEQFSSTCMYPHIPHY
jgi:Domain of unknown function (DUF1741)